MPISALVDIRERELAPLLSPWPTKQLPVGDIWIGLSGEDIAPGGIVAERKTVDDLEASILDGRYREQRTRLTTYTTSNRARPIYIIEGGMDRMWGKLSQQALQKYLNRLAIRYSVPVFHTESVQGTADLCRLLAAQIEEDATTFLVTDPASVAYTSTVSITKKGNKEDPRNFAACALQGCPGISAAAAEAILTAFKGNLEGVWTATEAELAAVQVGKRRLGPAVAKRLLGLLHASPPA